MTYMNSKFFTQDRKSQLIILFVAILFISPHLITQNMIIGSDSIFHFNRFYDTAQQIKENNFQYFASLYGFQQSGRIVNAFYGPFLAYFHGAVVLLSKNWFIYQVISNFLLFTVSGLSMLIFLKAGGLTIPKCRVGAILYMSSFSILYWVTRQGFSSWGAAILPFCLSIIFEVMERKEVPEYKLGILTALLFQTHFLSAFFLGVMYIPIFTYAFIKNKEKKKFLFHFVKEVLVFFLLTLNIWFAYFIIAKENVLTSPFVNYNMNSNTINQNSSYWLFNPASLVLILAVVLIKFLYHWKKSDLSINILFGIMLFFLVLSTSIIPWNDLVSRHIKVVELIQFPFRFFVPVTILAIYLFLYMVELGKWNQLLSVASILQVLILLFVTLSSWNDQENYIKAGSTVATANEDQSIIKQSFYAKDKLLALMLVEKPTPDYLPIYEEVGTSLYKLYHDKIIQNSKSFHNFVEGSNVVVRYEKYEEDEIELPIVIYNRTVLMSGGKEIPSDKIKLSSIGTPIIPTNLIKNNQVEASLNVRYTKFFVCVTLLFWALFCYKVKKKAIFKLVISTKFRLKTFSENQNID